MLLNTVYRSSLYDLEESSGEITDCNQLNTLASTLSLSILGYSRNMMGSVEDTPLFLQI